MCTWMQKLNLYLQWFFRYYSLKTLQSDWPRSFLHFTREPDFCKTCGFKQIKNLHINGLYFFGKIRKKKNYFCDIFRHYTQNENFSQKSASFSFLPLRHPNFMRSFRKILWTVLEKTPLPTDTLIYWQWWNYKTTFRLKAGVQKPKEGEIGLWITSFWCL